MSILVNQDTKIIVQGLTGSQVLYTLNFAEIILILKL